MPKNFEESDTWCDDVGYIDVYKIIDTMDLVDVTLDNSEDEYEAE